jgi:transposase, IS5 family
MYRQTSLGQLSFENVYLPFWEKLSGENRWVKRAAMIPWETFETSYAAQFICLPGLEQWFVEITPQPA